MYRIKDHGMKDLPLKGEVLHHLLETTSFRSSHLASCHILALESLPG